MKITRTKAAQAKNSSDYNPAAGVFHEDKAPRPDETPEEFSERTGLLPPPPPEDPFNQ